MSVFPCYFRELSCPFGAVSHVARVAHVGATLVGASRVSHLNGVDAMFPRVQLLLSEFPFVFLGDFGPDLRSVVLRMILRLNGGNATNRQMNRGNGDW